jgi:hypothetical protein
MQNILRGNVFCLNQNNLIEVKGIWFCWATDNQVRIDIVYLRVGVLHVARVDWLVDWNKDRG